MPPNSEADQISRSGFSAWKAAKYMLLGLALTVIFCAGLFTYLLMSPGASKHLIEFALTSLTNRPFYIEGDFDMTVGDSIVIRANDIHWDSPDWSDSPHIMRIAELELSVATASLLEPPVIIETGFARNAELEFEWTEDDEFNWDFFPDQPSREEPLDPLPLLLDVAQIQNVDVIIKDPVFPAPVVITVNRAWHKQDEKNNLVVNASYTIDNRNAILQGRIGPFPELIVARKVNMAARSKGILQSLRAIADVDELLTLKGAELDFLWQAPDIQPVLEVFNFPPDSTTGHIDVTAKLLTEDGDIRGFIEGDIGEFEVDGTFDAPEFDIYNDLHIDLTSKGPSARAAGAIVDIDNLPKKPYELAIKADSKPDGLHISQFEASTAGAELTATGVMPQAPAFIDADINLTVKGDNLLEFQDMSQSIQFIEAPFSADVNLKGNGNSYPDTLASNFTLAKMTGELSATLTEREDYLGSEFKYNLRFPDAQKLMRMFSVYLTKTAGMTVNGSANIVTEGIEIKDTSVLILNDLAVINGMVLNETADKNADLDITFSGPDFNDYSSFYLPFGLGPPLPYKLDAEVDIDKEGRYISKGSGTVGSSKIVSEWLVDLPSDQEIDATVKLEISGRNLEEWLQEYVIQNQRSRPFDFSSDIRINDDGISASNLSLKVNKATLTGEISSRWPEDPEDIDFDIKIKGENMEEDIPRLEVFIPAAVPFDIDAKGSLEDNKVNIANLDARIGSVEALIQGSATIPPAMATERLIISIKGDRLADLGSIEGWELRDVPFSMSAAVTTDSERLEIDKLIAQFGPSDFSGTIEYQIKDKPFFDIDIYSKNFEIGASLTREQDEYINAMLDDPSGSKDGRLIPDFDIPSELMNSFDGRVKLLVDTISRNAEKFSSMTVEATLQKGELSIPSFKADTTLGNIEASLDLNQAGENYELIMNMNASSVRLVSAKASATDRIPYGGHNIDFRLVGQGSNLRDIAATFDGYVWIRGGKREIENIKYSSLFGDAFTEVGALINPFYEKDPYTLIECERYFFEAKNGIMTTAPQAMIKTEKINIISAGVIDLKDESLKLGIETIPRKGIGVSASDLFTPFVRIGGTMEEPKAEVDPKGSLIEGGAAYLTLGLSIVGKSLYQRWIKADRSCSEFTEIAREARIKRDPAHVPPD